MKRAFGLVLILCCGGLVFAQGVPDFDLVIVNGRVMDPESALDAVRSVGIRGGSIAAIESGPLRGKTTIDATGQVVAPGFVGSASTRTER